MLDVVAGRSPLWQRILRFPLVRLVLLGGIVTVLMAWTETRLQAFEDRPALSIPIALGMGLVAVAIYAAYAKIVERRDVTELSGPGIGREWAVGAAIGAGLYTLCVLVLIGLGIYRIEGLNPVAFLLPAVAMAVKSGIFEELLFRGVIFRSVEDMAGSWIAILLSSAVFGLLHLLNPDAPWQARSTSASRPGCCLPGPILSRAAFGFASAFTWPGITCSRQSSRGSSRVDLSSRA